MIKAKNLKIIKFVLIIILTITIIPSVLNVFSMSSVVYTEEQNFFGVWNGEHWVIESVLNYDLPNLETVKQSAKVADYNKAKNELLNLYRSRQGVEFGEVLQDDFDIAQMAMRNIILGDIFVTRQHVSEQEGWVRFNVSKNIALGGKDSFTLIALGKTDNLITFNSINNLKNKPYLKVIINGQTFFIEAEKDTYIRAGDYSSTSYGLEEKMEIMDSGQPIDSNSRRAILQFDLSKYKGNLSSAELYLYGNSSISTTEVLVVRKIVSDYTWIESTHCWKNEESMTFSWENNDDGPDWSNPQSGHYIQFQNSIGNLRHIGYLVKEYEKTQEERFAEKAIWLLTDFASDFNDNPRFPDNLRLGQRQFNMVLFLNKVLYSQSLSPERFFVIINFIHKQQALLGNPRLEFPTYTNFRDELTFDSSSNHGIAQHKGLFAGTVYMPELKKYNDYLDLAVSRLDSLLEKMIASDGSYLEDCSSYAISGLNWFYDSLLVALNNNIVISERSMESILNWTHYIMDFSMPNGYDPNYGDAIYSPLHSFFNNFARLLNDPYLTYLGTRGRSGLEPLHKSSYYPDNKVALMRTGWRSQDMYLHINTQSGLHNHPDVNAIIMYAYGSPLLIDTGRKGYGGDAATTWQRTTNEAHNTLRIDERESSVSGGFTNKVNYSHSDSIITSYEGETFMYGTAPFTRNVSMIDGRFFVVNDYVRNFASGERTYELNWHFLPGSNFSYSGNKIETNFSGTANLEMLMSRDDLDITKESGYYTNSSTTNTHHYAKVKTKAQENFALITVMVPTKFGQLKQTQAVTLPVNDKTKTQAQAMKIMFDSTTNGYYFYSFDNAGGSFDNYYTDGKMSYVEEKSANSYFFILNAGKELTKEGQMLIQSPEKISMFSAKQQNNRLEISGSVIPSTDKAKAVKVYAPNITSVSVNGNIVAYEREGDYIYACISSSEEDAGLLIESIDSLPELETLNSGDIIYVNRLKNRINYYLAKEGDIAKITNYDKLLNYEKFIKALARIKIAETKYSLLPNIINITPQDDVLLQDISKILNELQEELPELDFKTLHLRSMVNEYIEFLNQKKQFSQVTYQTNSVSDFSLDYQGKANWYYYYQNASPGAPLIECTTTDRWVGPSSTPQIRADHILPNSTVKFPVRTWVSPVNGVVKLDITAYAHALMIAGNGARFVVSLNSLPFTYGVNPEGRTCLYASSDALFVSTILNPVDSNLNYNSDRFVAVLNVKVGDRIHLGVDPVLVFNANGTINSSASVSSDRVVIRQFIFFISNAACFEDKFDLMFDVVNRLNKLKPLDMVDNTDANELYDLKQKIISLDNNVYLPNLSLFEESLDKLYSFRQHGYNVIQRIYGQGNLIFEKEKYLPGELVKFLVESNSGYRLKEGSLKLDGVIMQSNSFIMGNDYSLIEAVFEPDEFSIIIEETLNGKILFNQEFALSGERIEIIVIPDRGYRLTENSLKINGVSIDKNNFVVPSEAIKVEANFEKINLTNEGCGSSINNETFAFIIVVILLCLAVRRKKA